MRLRAPRSQPSLLGNDSKRTTGKKLEIDDLVRGSGCWILSDAFTRVGYWKDPKL